MTEAMQICPFCDPTQPTTHHFLHGDSIHLHVHCSNTNLKHIREQSNTDISTALLHLGILFTHSPYPHTLGCDPFRTFLGHLLHQYDDNTTLSSDIPDPNIDPQPYHHSTMSHHLSNRMAPPSPNDDTRLLGLPRVLQWRGILAASSQLQSCVYEFY